MRQLHFNGIWTKFLKTLIVFLYIDDILIFSNDKISHKKDIETVFNILNEHNLKISATKSVFSVTSLAFILV